MDVLVFEVAQHHYGLPAADVRELIRAVSIHPLPEAPAVVEGVINVRGEIVPVLDIRSRFRLPGKALEPSDHFVVARTRERVVALRVDRAVDLLQIEPGHIEHAKKVVPRSEYVSGVAKVLDGLLLIHDLHTFLSEAESIAVDEAVSAADV